MSRTWNATFEAEPAGGDQGSTLDNKQRETRSEIRKRMDTLVSNWDADPDTPTSLDLEDDVVIAEHISGLVSTGAVDMNNVPEGTTKGGVFVFDGNAEAPAGDYNSSGDAIVRVKEAITFLPTSGTLEINGDRYAYTSVTVADKEFNLSGTLSATYSEDDTVYVVTNSVATEATTIEDQGGIATNGLKCKIVEIGDWDMDTDATTEVAHGLGANWKKIKAASIVIRNDTDDIYYLFESYILGSSQALAQWVAMATTNITLCRGTGGLFDSADFDSTSYNRGWITLWYEV